VEIVVFMRKKAWPFKQKNRPVDVRSQDLFWLRFPP
jgi:hypothetical protein